MAEIEPPSSKAQRLLAVIVERIVSGQMRENEPETFLAFSEMLELLGEPSPWVHSGSRLTALGLEDLHVWTEKHEELPKVTGLIVSKDGRYPHNDFRKWHGHEDDPEWERWWLMEANRAIRYDWKPYLMSSELEAPRMREDAPRAGASYQGIVVNDPPPAHIRQTQISVQEVLEWLAAGQTEGEILQRHTELTSAAVRASLAYAADRERRLTGRGASPAPAPSFAEKWSGQFELPAHNPEDARLSYLLERYERNRR